MPVDAETVHAVLAAQCPALLTGPPVQVAAGWDHTVWRSGAVVFRVPHQAEALDLAAGRMPVLRALGARLQVPVPVPLAATTPTPTYAGRIVAYRWLPGRPPAALALPDDARAAAALPLAHALRALHGIGLGQARALGLGAPADPGSLALHTRNAEWRATQLAPTRWGSLAARAAAAMADPPADLAPDLRRPCHGDLHPGQLLFDADHRLSGILDWDEACIGDPAFDLQLVYSLLPAAARSAFWAAYGADDAAGRARHIALSTSLALLAQGVAEGDAALEADAGGSVARALA